MTGSVLVPPGASIVLAAGVTLTVLGDFVAPAAQIFWGAGKVDLTRSRSLSARPEWWGARADDGRVDSLPALVACVAAHLVTMLGVGSYYIGSTWTVDRPNRRIWGIGRTKDALGTRIVLARGGRGTVMQVGSTRPPPSINDYLAGIDVRGLEFGRNAAPLADDSGPAVGLSVRHVLDCRFEDLRANEHMIGYSLRGAVRTYLRDCSAFRSLPGRSGDDVFVGFDLDGREPPIATGANASLYLIDCNARLGGPYVPPTGIGLRLLGAMSDSFVTRFETTSLPTGILLDGDSGRLGRSPGRFSQIDIHIDTPVLDQCGSTGIAVAGLGPASMLELVSPYVAVGATGTAAISVANCSGNLRIAGGQLVGSLASDAFGLRMERTAGVSAAGTAMLGFAHPVSATDSTGFELDIAILADSGGHGPAIALERCRRGSLHPRLAGRTGAYAHAVTIDRASHDIAIDTIGIDPAVLTDAGANITMGGAPVRPAPAATMVFIAS